MNEKEKPQEARTRPQEALNNNILFDDINNIPSTLPGCFGEYENQYFGKCIDCSVHLQCARTSMRGD